MYNYFFYPPPPPPPPTGVDWYIFTTWGEGGYFDTTEKNDSWGSAPVCY